MAPRSARPLVDADTTTAADAVTPDIAAVAPSADVVVTDPPVTFPSSRPPAETPESHPDAFAWVRYVGTHTGGVEVPGGVFVEHGAVVQVRVDLAADLCARVEYGEPQWFPAEAPAPSAPEES